MTGMLWFDNSTDPLPAKVARAAEYYRKKQGQAATVVYCHPSEIRAGDSDQAAGLTVKPWKAIQPGHFYLGIEGD